VIGDGVLTPTISGISNLFYFPFSSSYSTHTFGC
jgi:hypothetical protein